MQEDKALSIKSGFTTTGKIFSMATEDPQDISPAKFHPVQGTETEPLLPTSTRETHKSNISVTVNESLSSSEDDEDTDFSLSKVKNLIPIELALILNVFLAAFDSTITSSTYAVIGSEFQAANLGSWITTSYLLTSTSFQPLYGAFSDVLGRRACFFFATSVFALGCLGCSLSNSINALFFFRSLTGVGGGGLVTISTVINGDLIPISKRGLFQGFQNVLVGVGLILGASLGGLFTETVGWRFCFSIQVPVSFIGLIFGYLYIPEASSARTIKSQGFKAIVSEIDIFGSILMVSGLTIQLLSLTLGSLTMGAISFAIILLFIKVELNPNLSNPIIPLEKINGGFMVFIPLFYSILTGFAQMAYVFVLPLVFQISLGDSPSKAGLRLAIPSAFAMIGALISAIVMNANVQLLKHLVSGGALIAGLGNFLALFISPSFPERWLWLLLIPTNTGFGISNPATLFAFIFQFPKSMQATTTSALYLCRSIGQVWGVAIISSLIQWRLSGNLCKNFEAAVEAGIIDQDKINELMDRVTKSTTFIKELPTELQSVVRRSYEQSIRFGQHTAILACVVAFILAVTHGSWRDKQLHRS